MRGANLIDHSKVHIPLVPTGAMVLSDQDVYMARTVLKVRSGLTADDYWDLHIVPTAGAGEDARGRYTGPLAVALYVFVLSPRSRDHVRARSLDPLAEPLIDHAYFSDPEGYDRQVALDGVDLAHKLAETLPVSEMATLTPWSPTRREAIAEMPGGYWHPVGTCAMGPDSDPAAVAGCRRARTRAVQRVRRGRLADAGDPPRANTHLTTVALAARLAESIGEGGDGIGLRAEVATAEPAWRAIDDGVDRPPERG